MTIASYIDSFANMFEKPPGIHLKLGELLLIVHSLSNSTRFLPESTWQELMAWREVREQVWAAVYTLSSQDGELDENETALLLLTTEEAHQLLAVVPVTFRWGVGPDVGLSLSLILHRYSVGQYEHKEGIASGDKDIADNKAEDVSAD